MHLFPSLGDLLLLSLLLLPLLLPTADAEAAGAMRSDLSHRLLGTHGAIAPKRAAPPPLLLTAAGPWAVVEPQ